MIDPVTISGSCHFENSKPFKKWLSFVAYCYKFILSRIAALLLSCYPSAIRGTVRTVVVNSVYCKMFFIAFFHIFVKLFKRGFPRRTHSNSSSAIVFIRDIFFIITSSFHRTPNFVNLGFRQVMGFEVICFTQTSTTFAFTENKVISYYDSFYAAFTSAKVKKLISMIQPSCLLYCPSTETASDANAIFSCHNNLQIESCHININIMGVQA